VIVARSQFLPQVNATAGYTRTLMSQYSGISTGSGSDTGSSKGTASLLSNLPFGKENAYTLGITASQILYAGGRLIAQRDAAEARRRAADIEVTAAGAQLLLNVVQSYYDAVLTDQLVTIADSALAQTDTVFHQTELAYRLGVRSEFDMLRARVARDNQIPILMQRRNDRSAAYMRLKQLLNIPLDDSLLLLSSVDDRSERFAAISDTAADARAPVRQAAENVAASTAALRGAEGEWLPTVSLVSRYAPSAYPADLIPSYSDFRTDWTVGLNLSMPLYTGGRMEGTEMIARGTLDEAEARLRQGRETAALDARIALNELAQSEATLKATSGTVDQARRAYSIAMIRFREGISTQAELSDLRLLQEQALANQARAARNYQVARARLALLRDLPFSSGGGAPAAAAAAAAQQQQSAGAGQAAGGFSQPAAVQTGAGATTGVPGQ
jgi:outer membrane protein TolC